jgi:hypothetical protein
MRILLCLLSALATQAAPISFDATAKWQPVRGTASVDSKTQRGNHASTRVEPASESSAYVLSSPIALSVGKRYELSGWIHTENLQVRDLDRTPIATGASIAMASMPFDVHSESLGGTHPWTHVNLRFTATRSQDQVVLQVADGGAFTGKAWFEGVSIEEISQPDLPQKATLRSFGPGYRYPRAGWIFLHIEGEPYDRGYQHGYLMAREIEQYIDRCAAQLDSKSKSRAWDNGRTTANALFLRGFDQEILQEMKGIADGAAAAGAKYSGRPVDLIDIVTLNTITELGELNAAMPMTPTGLEGLGFRRPRGEAPTTDQQHDRCSAFAACGKATRDGKMVIGHVTWWPLTLAEQTNVMLDVQPTTGHRVMMQSYPGGIQSGTDWYQNDLGVVLTETTIDQSPFNVQGTPVAYRARKSIQYGDSIEKVVELLKTRNNGLYTNEWIIGDARTNEIAMIELGTYRTKLYRSSKNEWFGGTEGFYWGCNNAKDLNVRLEYVPDPKGDPQDLTFSPAPRDIKWQQMYQQYKGKIDETFGFTAFRTAPLVSASTMDAKITTSEMAPHMMAWALFGKSNQREWIPPTHDDYPQNKGLYSSGYRLFQPVTPNLADAPKATQITEAASNDSGRRSRRTRVVSSKDYLWKGWILPASDADMWLAKGSAEYYDALNGDDLENRVNGFRAQYRAAALEGEQPLSRLKSSITSTTWNIIAQTKGALLLDALRREMGDDAFYSLMRNFFDQNTTKTVQSAAFVTLAKRPEFFEKWLNGTGLPDTPDGPVYTSGMFRRRLASAIIVYGTQAEAGANRYAAEQWQRQFLEMYESIVPIKKDFEVSSEDLKSRDVFFVGRPETNSALARWANPIGLEYEGNFFRADGADHGSENDALIWAATNPEDKARMVVVAAGNSPLSTVLAARAGLGQTQHQVINK